MEDALLGDLIAYQKSRDKGVMVAARGLLQLYREVNPGMLKRRERGKSASMGMTKGNGPTPFGYVEKPAEDIEGFVVCLFPTCFTDRYELYPTVAPQGSPEDNSWRYIW